MKLSEELKRCLDGDGGGCQNCERFEAKSVLTCRGLLQSAYEQVKEYEKIFPFDVGDIVFVDSKTLPTENMNFEEDEKIPPYFKARVVSIRKNCKGAFVKLAVKAEWFYERIDPECGQDCACYDTEKYFTYPMSALNKTIFLNEGEAATLQALKETEEEK